MEHNMKISYLRIATGICGFGISEEDLDLLITLYEQVLEKKGDYTVDEMLKDRQKIERRIEENKRKKEVEKAKQSKE
jgi:ElaB/YqjD/DUF883 family membrane-anchored ribosome-binding protein